MSGCFHGTDAMDVVDRIKTIVTGHPVVLFMKGTPQFPMCPYSQAAAQMLERSSSPYHTVNLLADPELRASLPAYSNWASFPQLFVLGELIGGCDIMQDLEDSGELSRMLPGAHRGHAATDHPDREAS